MKSRLLALSIFSMLFIFYSCSKTNNTPTNPNPIVGLWMGTYTGTEVAGKNLYYSFDLRADSTVLSQSLGGDGNTYYSSGTWSLSGTNFTATITAQNFSNAGVVQNITATYSSANGTLTGQAVHASDATKIFVFTLNRVN